MASLWKHPESKYWYGCFTAADGRQLKRSTRETDKHKARIIVQAWEQAESMGSMGTDSAPEQQQLSAAQLELAKAKRRIAELEKALASAKEEGRQLQPQQQWGRKTSSAAERRIRQLEAKVRELESLVLPLDDSQKDALHQYTRKVKREFDRQWKVCEATVMKRNIIMRSKDYALFLAGFHPDASEEIRERARNRFVDLYAKHVLRDADKVKWPPQG
jgi:cob(I)alamin adenosyltransferase